MPGLIIWKDQEFTKLRKEMDRIFDRFLGEFGLSSVARTAGGFPVIDMTETEKSLIVKAEVSSIDPDDIDILISENRLSIKGEVKEDKVNNNKGFFTTELRYRSFSRTIQLPCRIQVDGVKATHKGGVLKIIMPKYIKKISRAIKVEK